MLSGLLLVPPGFLGLGATFATQEGDVAPASLVVGIGALVAWGTLAVATWVRNRRGDVHHTILDVF